MRLPGKPTRAQTLLFVKGGAVKLKPAKPKTANRKGKKIYTDDAIATLHLVRAFFRYKCGKLPASLMRWQTGYIALWQAFGITPDIREKLMRISPAAIVLKGKSLTKPAGLLKHRIPIRTFYTSEERKLPGFIQIDTVRHCGQTTSGQYILITTDVAYGWIYLYSLLNKANCRTFAAIRDVYADLPSPLPALGTIKKTTTACGPLVQVEQKNGAVVRKYIGYDRLEGCSPVLPCRHLTPSPASLCPP
jgi:hypothetical protein